MMPQEGPSWAPSAGQLTNVISYASPINLGEICLLLDTHQELLFDWTLIWGLTTRATVTAGVKR